MTPPDPDPHHRPHVPGDKLLSKRQVAEILGDGITAETVVRSWRTWGLTPHHVGKQLRWWESDVYEWIKRQRAD